MLKNDSLEKLIMDTYAHDDLFFKTMQELAENLEGAKEDGDDAEAIIISLFGNQLKTRFLDNLSALSEIEEGNPYKYFYRDLLTRVALETEWQEIATEYAAYVKVPKTEKKKGK